MLLFLQAPLRRGKGVWGGTLFPSPRNGQPQGTLFQCFDVMQYAAVQHQQMTGGQIYFSIGKCTQMRPPTVGSRSCPQLGAGAFACRSSSEIRTIGIRIFRERFGTRPVSRCQESCCRSCCSSRLSRFAREVPLTRVIDSILECIAGMASAKIRSHDEYLPLVQSVHLGPDCVLTTDLKYGVHKTYPQPREIR